MVANAPGSLQLRKSLVAIRRGWLFCHPGAASPCHPAGRSPDPVASGSVEVGQAGSINELRSPFKFVYLVYFGLLGFAFLLVEIPLLQRFILYLGHPAYAVTAVLFALLLFSGLGSRFCDRIPLGFSLAALFILVLCMPMLLTRLFEWTLGLPLAVRLGVTVITLAPLGFLMGIPFPGGIQRLVDGQVPKPHDGRRVCPRTDVPWIWAVNGAASVVSPIMAALLALTYSFSTVLWLGGLCYAAALLTVWVYLRRNAFQRPVR